ncbi:hypothetical protein BG011_008653 [Mortierella polycephala]|uniref:Uncharacterized protein n=1 Tax=Mortierella polycephala TaxID=41804 RepID=A0A9P6PML3_9FUNG|nr:hypothetical protein BG011_008653 [Mortierella polycephala]
MAQRTAETRNEGPLKNTPAMNRSSNTTAVFSTALALRLALFQFPTLVSILGGQVEIATPITSFKRLSEGVFLYRNGVPPYDGGVFHQAPLLLGLFYPVISSPILVKLLYILSDLAIGFMLLRITQIKDRDAAKDERIRHDLTPNLGLFWYFFIEMFDQFRPFFIIVFQIHVFIFAAPISIKLRNHPLFVAFLLSTVMGTFKGYPSVGDASLYLGLLPLCSEIFKYMRYSFLIANLFMYSSLLAPIFWYLWVYVGSGNANFFYAIGLVYGIGEIILMIDTTYALMRRDFEAQSPPQPSDEASSHGWDREVVQK